MNPARPSETDPDAPSGGASANLSWSRLVERIRTGDPSGLEELYRVFSAGIRFHLRRHMGPQDIDDTMHDVFLIITQSIQRGELREPERLMGYVRTIVRRQVAAHIDKAVQARCKQTNLDSGMYLSDRSPDPERSAIERQNLKVARRILDSIPRRDREVLVRFYLKEQPSGQICQELNLSETQFRLIKSRAKARFSELCKARFAWRAPFRH